MSIYEHSSTRETPSRNNQLATYAGLLLTTAMWATSGVFIKTILRTSDISQFTLAFYRDLSTFFLLFLALLFFRRNLLRIFPGDLLWFLGLGGIGLGLFHILWNFGVDTNGVAVSTVQQAVMPIILGIAARLFFGEPLNRRKIAAVFLTFTGAVFISGLFTGKREDTSIRGVILGFGIPLAYALFNLFSKKMTGKYHPLTILTYGFGFASLILLPFPFIFPFERPTGLFCLRICALALISTTIPFFIYVFLLRKLQVGVAGILSMAEIPLAALYAYILFREKFVWYQWIGAGLVISGVGLFAIGKRRKHDIHKYTF